MPTRSHLTRSRPRQALIDLGDGDTLTITYDANRLTTSWLEQGLLRDDQNDARSLAKAVAEVLLGWDVTEDDGSPWPPTADNIATMAIPTQRTLIAQMLEAAIPTSEEGKGSATTSSTPNTSSSGEPVSLQNGHETSPSPPLSELPSTR